MDAIRIACGVWRLVEDGIGHYTKEYGRKPIALKLHPAHIDEFRRGSECNPAVLDDISVIVSEQFPLAALLDESGTSHEL